MAGPWPYATSRAVPLLDAAAARAGDAAAVAAGESWPALMERAAGHLARGVVTAAHGGYGHRVTIVVGNGDNGGDGWAAARLLRTEHGCQAWVVAPDGIDTELSAAAQANRSAWLASGGRTSSGTGQLERALAWADVAVDALLGTGSRGAPRGASATAVDALNRARAAGTTIVACDLPTGVDADDGAVHHPAVFADVTVTFGGIKRGLVLHPGAQHAGRVLLGELGSRYAPPPVDWQALTPAGAASEPLHPAADKWARGRILIVAGAAGTSGAATLAGGGALHAGAGLVSVVTPKSARIEVAGRSDPGLMIHGLPSYRDGSLAVEAVDALDELGLVAYADVVVAGPGTGRGPGVRAVIDHLRRQARVLVLDADGLNVYRDDPNTLADHAGTLVLTPHARELARIGGGADGEEAWAERVERVPALAARLDATIAAKGPGTLVAAPDGRAWVCPVGGPPLGSGGSGDVLAGVVGAAIAAAIAAARPADAPLAASPPPDAPLVASPPPDAPLAAAQAVWWHAAAGNLSGAGRAGRATAAGLLPALGTVLDRLARARGGQVATMHGHPRAYDPAPPPIAGSMPWAGW